MQEESKGSSYFTLDTFVSNRDTAFYYVSIFHK